MYLHKVVNLSTQHNNSGPSSLQRKSTSAPHLVPVLPMLAMLRGVPEVELRQQKEANIQLLVLSGFSKRPPEKDFETEESD